MVRPKSSLLAAFGAASLCAAFAAHAQDNAVGPAQLKDFRLPGQTVTRAQQQPAPPPVTLAPPPPVAARPQAAPPQSSPAPATATPRTRPTPAAPVPAPVAVTPGIAAPRNIPENPRQPSPDPAPSAQNPSETPENPATFPWFYAALGAAALALLAFAFLRTRRRRWYEADEAQEAPAPVREPLPLTAREKAVRPEPTPRPWLELSLKAERAQATLTETVVQFELEIRNTGKAAARNLRIDVKMFNAGKEQDKEIGAFFRIAGRESTKCHLPGIAAGTTGAIHGQVTMAREDMKAVKLEEKLLFVPVIGVNALYDWADGETGQTSRTWVVGRELEQQSEKMGAFRVDLGPRIWRTIGQRQHKLVRQV